MTTPLHQYLQAHAAPAHGHQAAMHALRAGKLEATWLWHTFPRLQGTGPETDTPALSNRYEAEDYLNHPLLGLSAHLLDNFQLSCTIPACHLLDNCQLCCIIPACSAA